MIDLATERKAAGLTQAQAAQRMQVTRLTIVRWEGGTRAMSPRDRAMWLHVLGVQRIPFGGPVRAESQRSR